MSAGHQIKCALKHHETQTHPPVVVQQLQLENSTQTTNKKLLCLLFSSKCSGLLTTLVGFRHNGTVFFTEVCVISMHRTGFLLHCEIWEI